MAVPPAVHAIWWIGLVATLLVLVPLAIYLLHRTWHAARGIQRYAADARAATEGIARHTANVPALDTTVAVATEMVTLAGAVERKLDTAAEALAARASRAGS